MPPMRASLRHLLTHQIPASVSPVIWARGAAYSYDRRVEHVIEIEDRIEATVRGSSPYQVALWGDGPGPGGRVRAHTPRTGPSAST